MRAATKRRTRARASAPRPLRASFAHFIASIVVLASQLVGMGHMLLVTHQECEHGELIHGEAHAKAERHASPEALAKTGEAAKKADKGALLREGEGVSSEHDHCDPFAVPAALVSIGPSCGDLTLLDATILPWSVRAAPERRAAGILAFAPKSSPPV